MIPSDPYAVGGHYPHPPMSSSLCFFTDFFRREARTCSISVSTTNCCFAHERGVAFVRVAGTELLVAVRSATNRDHAASDVYKPSGRRHASSLMPPIPCCTYRKTELACLFFHLVLAG